MSPLYSFILNQWIMGKDEMYVQNAVSKGYITQDESTIIINTPKA